MNCLLCLKSNENGKYSIVFNSSDWQHLNVQYIVEKHLWKLEALNGQSYICQGCWQELYNFHELYLKLETARSNLDDSVNTEQISKDVERETKEDIKISTNNKKVSKPEPEIVFLREENSIEIYEKEDEEEPSSLKTGSNRKRSRKRTSARNISRKRCNTDIKELKYNENSDEIGTKLKIENDGDKENKNVDEIKTKLELKITENDLKQNTTEEDDQNDRVINDDDAANSTKLDKLSDEDKFIAENFKITCDLCQIQLDTFCAMVKHYRDSHNQRGYVECCKSKFFARIELIDHINIHKNPEYLKCKYCDKVFAKRTCLRLHIKNVHEEMRAQCDICGKSLSTETVLKRHKLTHNTRDKMIPCKQCGKSYLSKYSLKNHMRLVHFTNTICHLCGKSILYNFRRHMLKHEGKAPPKVSCNMCDLQFSDMSCLNRHVRMKHPADGTTTEFKCSECPKVFAADCSLKTHVRRVHNNQYARKCTLCEKTFKAPVALAEHLSRHRGEPLYTCGFCPRKFYSSGNMHSHRKRCSRKNLTQKSALKTTEDE